VPQVILLGEPASLCVAIQAHGPRSGVSHSWRALEWCKHAHARFARYLVQ
jgi:hypothetical protein